MAVHPAKILIGLWHSRLEVASVSKYMTSEPDSSHRSHFGSRYKSSCCCIANLLLRIRQKKNFNCSCAACLPVCPSGLRGWTQVPLVEIRCKIWRGCPSRQNFDRFVALKTKSCERFKVYDKCRNSSSSSGCYALDVKSGVAFSRSRFAL